MTIHSRGKPVEALPLGRQADGQFLMLVTEDELMLINTYLSSTRFGPDRFKMCAMSLCDKIEEMTDINFMSDSYNTVEPEYSILDDNGYVEKSLSGDQIVIEV